MSMYQVSVIVRRRDAFASDPGKVIAEFPAVGVSGESVVDMIKVDANSTANTVQQGVVIAMTDKGVDKKLAAVIVHDATAKAVKDGATDTVNNLKDVNDPTRVFKPTELATPTFEQVEKALDRAARSDVEPPKAVDYPSHMPGEFAKLVNVNEVAKVEGMGAIPIVHVDDMPLGHGFKPGHLYLFSKATKRPGRSTMGRVVDVHAQVNPAKLLAMPTTPELAARYFNQYGNVGKSWEDLLEAKDLPTATPDRVYEAMNRMALTGVLPEVIVEAARLLGRRADGTRLDDPAYVERFVHRNAGRSVFVKDGGYFRAQGGMTELWGGVWVRCYAKDLDEAYVWGRRYLPQYGVPYGPLLEYERAHIIARREEEAGVRDDAPANDPAKACENDTMQL